MTTITVLVTLLGVVNTMNVKTGETVPKKIIVTTAERGTATSWFEDDGQLEFNKTIFLFNAKRRTFKLNKLHKISPESITRIKNAEIGDKIVITVPAIWVDDAVGPHIPSVLSLD